MSKPKPKNMSLYLIATTEKEKQDNILENTTNGSIYKQLSTTAHIVCLPENEIENIEKLPYVKGVSRQYRALVC